MKLSLTKKRLLAFIITGAFILPALSACKKSSLLSPKDPVTLTMGHVFGEQADSPMNELIDEFNRTEGKNKGVIINVTMMSNASQIGAKLSEAAADKPGSPNMPDLFFCHASNAADLGADKLYDWKQSYSDSELNSFVGEFVAGGEIDDKLLVLPTTKSTHLLFVAGGVFDRFAAAAGASLDDLKTWDGFFATAEKYFNYSGGKPFCALDYLLRAAELYAYSLGGSDLYSDNWYDFNNETFLSVYKKFAAAISKGHIIVSDLYSNTQVMTGETPCGLGSSASILYYNDEITYPDNTREPMNLQVLPMPKAGGETEYATYAGVGLSAYYVNDKKAEAAAVFSKWFTDETRNLNFVVKTGYMPVKKGAFEKISDYDFSSAAYKNLYSALKVTKSSRTFLPEPNIAGYFDKAHALYADIRLIQKDVSDEYKKSGAINTGVYFDRIYSALLSA